MNTRHAAAVLSASLSLGVVLPASAKVSTSLTLCFAPSEVSVSPDASAKLYHFSERVRSLGNPSGLFVLTVAEPDLEPSQASTSRVQQLLSRLADQSVSTEFTDVRQVQQKSVDMGCPARHVAVELEAIFPHDGYR